jgi:hypothetical protein
MWLTIPLAFSGLPAWVYDVQRSALRLTAATITQLPQRWRYIFIYTILLMIILLLQTLTRTRTLLSLQRLIDRRLKCSWFRWRKPFASSFSFASDIYWSQRKASLFQRRTFQCGPASPPTSWRFRSWSTITAAAMSAKSISWRKCGAIVLSFPC